MGDQEIPGTAHREDKDMYEIFIPTTGQWIQIWGDLDAAKNEQAYWADYYGIDPDMVPVVKNGRTLNNNT